MIRLISTFIMPFIAIAFPVVGMADDLKEFRKRLEAHISNHPSITDNVLRKEMVQLTRKAMGEESVFAARGQHDKLVFAVFCREAPKNRLILRSHVSLASRKLNSLLLEDGNLRTTLQEQGFDYQPISDRAFDLATGLMQLEGRVRPLIRQVRVQGTFITGFAIAHLDDIGLSAKKTSNQQIFKKLYGDLGTALLAEKLNDKSYLKGIQVAEHLETLDLVNTDILILKIKCMLGLKQSQRVIATLAKVLSENQDLDARQLEAFGDLLLTIMSDPADKLAVKFFNLAFQRE